MHDGRYSATKRRTFPAVTCAAHITEEERCCIIIPFAGKRESAGSRTRFFR